jgi:hypothetical protein
MRYRCIRIDYRDGSGGLSYLPMEVGGVYEIVSTWSDRVTIGGYVFSIGENRLYLRKFEDYFVSIEDYRDLLIEEICE